ncbi:DUF7793 family protein [Pontibacter cellulosilyticus]|uniref:DUF7793 domain-containing protein n=1 Tax=Pontibacter cellulosilyticus TaxID=1720253 RepID=A0A923N545_9BACT|nr:hypothetical protein [Pontibacter cellulosilyticus]MBC5992406.1 hypothetical protein [Pontibacter cellulosilyticus]
MGKFKNVSEVIETPYISMFIEEGILHVYYKRIENMDLDIAKECVLTRKEFTNNRVYPCLINVIQMKSSTKEARDFFATEGNEGISASALIVNSSAFKMMANFYIMVNRPKNPTRLFTDKASALEWLEQFKK